MKTLLTMLLFIGLALAGAAQEETPRSLVGVDVIPAEFTGTNFVVVTNQNGNLLKQYLQREIVYPQNAINCLNQGTEVAEFTVTATGEVEDIKIINSVCPAIDQEFIRALETTSGMWKPALKDGKNHACYKEVSLAFSLNTSQAQTEKIFTKQAKKNYLRGSEMLIVDHKIKKAEKYFDRAINYMPYDANLLYLRGICRYETGNEEGAMEDWNRYSQISGYMAPPEEMAADLKGFEAYQAFLDREIEK